MFKKTLLIILLPIFLVSCGAGDESSNTEEVNVGLVLHDGADFSLSIPGTWEIIEDQDKILPKPNSGEIELAVTAQELKNGLANNLLVLSSMLHSYTTSFDYSMLNNIGATQDYMDYLKIESKEFYFNDDEKSIVYVFEAKYNVDTPKLKFIQTARVCKTNKGFHFTIALPTSTVETDKYLEMIKTFTCK